MFIIAGAIHCPNKIPKYLNNLSVRVSKVLDEITASEHMRQLDRYCYKTKAAVNYRKCCFRTKCKCVSGGKYI